MNDTLKYLNYMLMLLCFFMPNRQNVQISSEYFNPITKLTFMCVELERFIQYVDILILEFTRR